MTRIRLLPIVLFGVTALLCLKLLGLVAGVGSFAVGPTAATAAGDGGHGGEAAPAAAEAPPAPRGADFPGQLVDLAAEAEALKKQQKDAGHGEAGGDGEEPAADAHGAEPAAEAPADAAAAPGDLPAEPAADAAAGDPSAEAPADAHSAEAPTDAHSGEAPADAHSAEAPAGADAENGEEGAAASPVTTVRPDEFKPGTGTSETLVLESLAERRKILDTREDEIATRERLLQAAEAKLQARIDELKSLEAQLGGAPAEKEQEDQEKIKGLVAMYEAMKPKAAARVFDGLDMDVLISVARAMSPRRMSAIMAVMNPERAALLTTALAGSQAPREVIVRRADGDFAAPGGSSDATAPQDLPKIMPATPSDPPPG